MSDGSNTLEPNSAFGQHRILRLLGHGGMGEVYEVEHELTGDRHALKILSTQVMEVPGALGRFQREAKVMARLKHSGIVRVDLTGKDQGRHWLRMELMPGREVKGKRVITLEQYMQAKGGRLPESEVKSLLGEILEALVHAHAQGLVHRDLKPANVLLDSERLKIADFGLVNAAGAEWMDTQVRSTVINQDEEDTLIDDGSGTGSRSRAIMGTFAFMSPEQKKGQPADARSDLYAVGLMVFRMLTGLESPGMKRPSELGLGLNMGWDAWLIKTLEENPADRFTTAAEMQESLSFQASSTTVPQVKSLPHSLPPSELKPVIDHSNSETALQKSSPGGFSPPFSFGIFAAFFLLLIPIHKDVVSLLLVISMAITFLLLPVGFLLKDPLRISFFPTILISVGFFCWGLDVASTRLILLDGDAGSVIQSFGTFIVGGNYVVGAVIFLLLVIFNFIFVTRQAKRMSEISSRFTLEVMPGMEVQLISDTNSGALTESQVYERRKRIEKDARLHASMNRASNFLRWFAIASVFIILVNFIGGILIGYYQRDLAMTEALQTYTILSIGDGLVTQFSGFLLLMAIGFFLKRSSNSYGLVFSIQPNYFAVSGVMLLLLSFFLAETFWPFFILSMACFYAFYFRLSGKARKN